MEQSNKKQNNLKKFLKKLAQKPKLKNVLLLLLLLPSCSHEISDSFCFIYEPLLPSKNDTLKTQQHLNIYYELYELECNE